jgi:hypothetical protein
MNGWRFIRCNLGSARHRAATLDRGSAVRSTLSDGRQTAVLRSADGEIRQARYRSAKSLLSAPGPVHRPAHEARREATASAVSAPRHRGPPCIACRWSQDQRVTDLIAAPRSPQPAGAAHRGAASRTIGIGGHGGCPGGPRWAHARAACPRADDPIVDLATDHRAGGQIERRFKSEVQQCSIDGMAE